MGFLFVLIVAASGARLGSVRNRGKGCYSQCQERGGACSEFCGAQGACCRLDYEDGPACQVTWATELGHSCGPSAVRAGEGSGAENPTLTAKGRVNADERSGSRSDDSNGVFGRLEGAMVPLSEPGNGVHENGHENMDEIGDEDGDEEGDEEQDKEDDKEEDKEEDGDEEEDEDKGGRNAVQTTAPASTPTDAIVEAKLEVQTGARDSAAASDAIDAAAHSAVLARHEAMQAAAKVHRAREALRKIQAGSAEWLSRMSQLQEAEQQAAVATRKAKDAKVVVSRVAKRVVMAQQSGAGNRI